MWKPFSKSKTSSCRFAKTASEPLIYYVGCCATVMCTNTRNRAEVVRLIRQLYCHVVIAADLVLRWRTFFCT